MQMAEFSIFDVGHDYVKKVVFLENVIFLILILTGYHSRTLERIRFTSCFIQSPIIYKILKLIHKCFDL